VLIVLCPCWPVGLLMSGAIVRAFVLFHDASHGSLTSSRTTNRLVAALASPWVSRNQSGWSASHNHHHKVIGGDPLGSFPDRLFEGRAAGYDTSRTVLFSQQEFESWPVLKQAWVRVLRDPIFFFVIVVPGQWFWYEWTATAKWMCINLVFLYLGGVSSCLCYALAFWFSVCIGGLLFHLQHHVNPGYWKADGHDHEDACLQGSSYLLVPWCLKWVTLGVEYHHIHHLCVRVPCYELQRCHEACCEVWLKDVVRVPMSKAFRSCFHAMWDDKAERYVSFDMYRWLGLED